MSTITKRLMCLYIVSYSLGSNAMGVPPQTARLITGTVQSDYSVSCTDIAANQLPASTPYGLFGTFSMNLRARYLAQPTTRGSIDNRLNPDGSTYSAYGELDFNTPAVANISVKIYDQSICQKIGAAFDVNLRSCSARPIGNLPDGSIDLRDLYPKEAQYYTSNMAFDSGFADSLINSTTFYGAGGRYFENGVVKFVTPSATSQFLTIEAQYRTSKFSARMNYNFRAVDGSIISQPMYFFANCQIPVVTTKSL